MAGGFHLTDETYTLPPVRISRKEAFSFGLARKLLAHFEGTPKPDMSPQAVTQRLRRTAELRRVCLALRKPPASRVKESSGPYRAPKKRYTATITDNEADSVNRLPSSSP